MIRIAIAAGGLAGAVARHAVGSLALDWAGRAFPWGTLLANVAGAWMLGVLMPVLPSTVASPAVRAGLTIGFCAGFTTFSTFSFEAVALVQAGHTDLAAFYVGASLLLGFTAMLAGLETGAWVLRRRHPHPPLPASTTTAPPEPRRGREPGR
jgi:fluoride exporter